MHVPIFEEGRMCSLSIPVRCYRFIFLSYKYYTATSIFFIRMPSSDWSERSDLISARIINSVKVHVCRYRKRLYGGVKITGTVFRLFPAVYGATVLNSKVRDERLNAYRHKNPKGNWLENVGFHTLRLTFTFAQCVVTCSRSSACYIEFNDVTFCRRTERIHRPSRDQQHDLHPQQQQQQ